MALCIVFFLAGCKEQVESVPEISLFTPSENQIFQATDTIHITGSITDETGLVSVSYSLVDSDFVIAVAGSTFPADRQTQVDLDVRLPINNIELPSGAYYIKVVAYNESAAKQKFLKVFIEEMPRQLQDIIIIAEENPYSTVVSAMDMNFNLEGLFHIDHSVKFSGLNVRHQQMYLITDQPELLTCYTLSNHQVLWNDSPGYPYPVFTGLSVYDLIYVASGNGAIKAYNHEGIIKLSTQPRQDTVPENILLHGDILIADHRLLTSKEHVLIQYYLSSGVSFNRYVISLNTIAFYSVDFQRVILFGNTAENKGRILYYYPEEDIIQPLSQIEEALVCIEMIEPTKFFIVTESGIYTYQTGTSSIIPFFVEEGIETIKYDPINQYVFLAKNQLIRTVIYPGATDFGEMSIDNTIKALHLRYNK